MSDSHTPEPWTYLPIEHGGYKIVPASDASFKICRIENAITYLMDFDEAAEPDARRICAAVNACKGIETETLETRKIEPCDICGAASHNLRANRAEARADEAERLLRECADRLEACAIAGGSDPEYAAIAVEAYRAFLDGSKP